MATTCFRGVDWIVGWNEGRQDHVYLKGADLAFSGNEITYVGKQYDGDCDVTIPGSGLCLMPGLVDIHAHPASEVYYRGLREDHCVPEHYMTGLFERSCAFDIDAEDLKFGAEVSYADLLRSGVTSLVDITYPFPGWRDVIERSGLRVFAAPGFNTSHWRRDNAHELKYSNDPGKGQADFEAALALIDELVAHPSGRLSGVVSPVQIDNNTPEMLAESHAAARKRGLPWTTHVSQAVLEVHVMIGRHGITPLKYLDELGLLGRGTILGHALFLDDNSWIRWHAKQDLALLGDSGTAVAHCPTPFMRYGIMLEHFSRYREAGVVLGIGTDTLPHNMLEDLRYAAIMGRMASRDGLNASTGEVFHAGTAGGARALMRDDLGKLSAGAKADIVAIDLNHPLMRPGRDPLKALIHSAAERAVKDVWVDGQQVVRDHEVLTLDYDAAVSRLDEGQARMLATAPRNDYAGRTDQEIVPLSFELVD